MRVREAVSQEIMLGQDGDSGDQEVEMDLTDAHGSD